MIDVKRYANAVYMYLYLVYYSYTIRRDFKHLRPEDYIWK